MTKKDIFSKFQNELTRLKRKYPNSPRKVSLKFSFYAIKSIFSKHAQLRKVPSNNNFPSFPSTNLISPSIEFCSDSEFLKQFERDFAIIDLSAFDAKSSLPETYYINLIHYLCNQLHLDIVILATHQSLKNILHIKNLCDNKLRIIANANRHILFPLLALSAIFIGEYHDFTNVVLACKMVRCCILLAEQDKLSLHSRLQNQIPGVLPFTRFVVKDQEKVILESSTQTAINNLLKIKEIYFVTLYHDFNMGDRTTSPLLYYSGYFNRYICKSIHLTDIPYLHWVRNKLFIWGGGGVLDCSDELNNYFNIISKNNKIIIWSTGFNTHYDVTISNPLDLRKISLVGVRDYFDKDFNTDKYHYCPCVSCLSPLFDIQYSIKRKVGLVFHGQRDTNILPEFEAIENDVDFADAIQFIGESEYIVTTTYHGLYWATLLGKKVILAFPFSNRFDRFKYKPVLYSGNLEDDMKKAQSYPHAKEECRYYNKIFFSLVKTEIDNFQQNL